MPYNVEAKCPCCKKEAKGKDEVEKLFGWRKINANKTIPQSYCRVCRTARCEKRNPKH